MPAAQDTPQHTPVYLAMLPNSDVCLPIHPSQGRPPLTPLATPLHLSGRVSLGSPVAGKGASGSLSATALYVPLTVSLASLATWPALAARPWPTSLALLARVSALRLVWYSLSVGRSQADQVAECRLMWQRRAGQAASYHGIQWPSRVAQPLLPPLAEAAATRPPDVCHSLAAVRLVRLATGVVYGGLPQLRAGRLALAVLSAHVTCSGGVLWGIWGPAGVGGWGVGQLGAVIYACRADSKGASDYCMGGLQAVTAGRQG
jgi:hypothetical protein